MKRFSLNNKAGLERRGSADEMTESSKEGRGGRRGKEMELEEEWMLILMLITWFPRSVVSSQCHIKKWDHSLCFEKDT